MLAAPEDALAKAAPDEPAVSGFVALLRAGMLQALRTDVAEEIVLTDTEALECYLLASAAHLADEQMRVLFLNSRNAILRDEVMFRGTVNGVRAYPREMLKRAIEVGSTALILVHNHPSGDPEPSLADILETRRICEAAKTLDIVVHDHFVVGRFGITSFRARGLLPSVEQAAGPVANDDDPRQAMPLAGVARALSRDRARLGRYFDAELFADPALDILLELFAAYEERREICVSSLCIEANIPATTTLRWVSVLCDRGLVVRRGDPGDRRRVLVTLSPHAAEAMRAYLAAVTNPHVGSAQARGRLKPAR